MQDNPGGNVNIHKPEKRNGTPNKLSILLSERSQGRQRQQIFINEIRLQNKASLNKW